MTNDFLKLKQKNKKIDEIRHFDDDPKRLPNGRFTFKDNNVIDAEVVPETKRTGKKLSDEEVASIGKTGAQIFKGVQGISDSAARGLEGKKKEIKTYKKYPNLDDKDLAAKLKRLQMEQQYSDLTGDTVVTKTGAEKAKEALQTIGAVAGIGASLVGIGWAIYQMRHGQGGSK